MIRRKLVLADEDEQYLKEIRYEFMEKAPQLELITFTKREKLHQYLEQGGAADILVVDEALADERLNALPLPVTRIVLSPAMYPVDGFEVIKKYQRMEALLNTVLLKYAQDSGTLEVVRGDSRTRMAAFYSPAGGTGKTALALAMAAAGARNGLRTLYLNLEEVDSVKDVLEQAPGCLSDVFLAIKTSGMQAGIKLKECIQLEPAAGFYYVPGVESISEYEEIDGGDIKRLLEAVRELASYDLVVLDGSSGFEGRTRRILEEADVVFVPVLEEEGSIAKLERFLGESALHGNYDAIVDKMSLVMNKAGAVKNGPGWIPDQVRNRVPCCTSIMALPVLMRRRDILQAGNQLLPVMDPMLQLVQAERGNTDR